MVQITVVWFVVLCFAIGVSCEHAHRSRAQSQSPNRAIPISDPEVVRQTAEEITNGYWNNQAQASLKAKLGFKKIADTKPKNIIFFIADGMSLQTSAVARVHAGGDEKHSLSFDKFPYMGLSKTYCVDRQVPDSAATATAFFTGVKTNYGLVGVDSNVRRYNCEDHANKNYHTKSIADWAMDAGKAAGLVTTVHVTHASPSPLYAHSANRYWESDKDMSEHCNPSLYEDITEQLVFGETGKKLKVVLGGGRSKFLPKTTVDDEGTMGEREDGKNLIDDWLAQHKNMGKAEYVWNKDQLLNVNTSSTEYLLGLFADKYVKYDHETKSDPLEPTLSDMTEMAIKMLRNEENGFFLFVEGGRVDTAHHDSYAKSAVDEARAFSDAIEMAQRMTDAHDTLIVVSADHAHTMQYGGYPKRRNDIFGVAAVSKADGKPYSTLSYANGRGVENMYTETYGERADITTHDLGAFDFRYYGHFPTDAATHAGDDVGVYATGPQSHLFAGSYEQHTLPLLMAYAAKIGPYRGTGVRLALSGLSIVLLVVVHLVRNVLF